MSNETDFRDTSKFPENAPDVGTEERPEWECNQYVAKCSNPRILQQITTWLHWTSFEYQGQDADPLYTVHLPQKILSYKGGDINTHLVCSVEAIDDTSVGYLENRRTGRRIVFQETTDTLPEHTLPAAELLVQVKLRDKLLNCGACVEDKYRRLLGGHSDGEHQQEVEDLWTGPMHPYSLYHFSVSDFE